MNQKLGRNLMNSHSHTHVQRPLTETCIVLTAYHNIPSSYVWRKNLEKHHRQILSAKRSFLKWPTNKAHQQIDNCESKIYCRKEQENFYCGKKL
jgi:hypothetical protein